MGNPVVHFEIHGPDGQGLAEFYSGVFGWNVNADNAVGYGVVDTQSEGGIGGGIAGDGTTGTLFYIAVPDPEATLKQIEAKGGRVVMPVTVLPGMVTMAQFADPQGNVIGIVADQPPPA